ncbi:histone deacetylase family protein [Methanocaldococcus jannaschii]|nr:histone deacetylase family protein [Methanocaldococcus jannaschii]
MPKILYNPEVLGHKPKSYHVENPERVLTILNSLKSNGFDDIVLIEGKSTINEILEIHSRDYVYSIINLSKSFNYYDGDTYLCDRTLDAALTAFKLAKEAVKLALKDRDLYFALTRPPGHHAGISGRALGAMSNGFCIFNNIAGAARLAKNYMKKVIIIDFDVHHGNGTQEIFWNDNRVIHIDFHQRGIYPGTGDILDIGGEEAKGTKINLPFPAHSTDADYIFAWNEIVEPILNYFSPDTVLVSAGFDAFINDGLASMDLTETFYRFVGAKLSGYSVTAVLEGGYSIGLKYAPPAFLDGYVDAKDVLDNLEDYTVINSNEVKSMVKNVKKIIGEYLDIF